MSHERSGVTDCFVDAVIIGPDEETLDLFCLIDREIGLPGKYFVLASEGLEKAIVREAKLAQRAQARHNPLIEASFPTP
jgi:hypothetical protein